MFLCSPAWSFTSTFISSSLFASRGVKLAFTQKCSESVRGILNFILESVCFSHLRTALKAEAAVSNVISQVRRVKNVTHQSVVYIFV